jgi:N-acetylglucosaminyl-diphospho-decaprenol L-rhamnosyltransferase
LSNLIHHLRSRTRIGIVGPRLLNTDGSLQTSCVQAYPTILNQVLDAQRLRQMFPLSSLWGMQALYLSPDTTSCVEVVSGACLMIDRLAFQQVGGFDETYFMYVEDVDLCRRTRRAGFDVLFVGSCEVTHHGGKSSAMQGEDFVNLRQKEAMLQFFLHTRGPVYAVLYRSALAIAALARLLTIAAFRVSRQREAGTAFRSTSHAKWVSLLCWTLGLRLRPRSLRIAR